jgi:serine protease
MRLEATMPRSYLSSRHWRLECLEDRSVPSAASVIDLPDVQVETNTAAQTHLLVAFKPGQPPVALPGTTIGQSFDLVSGLYQVDLDGATLEEALAEYRADPRVATAEPDFSLTVSWAPNDPRFGEQYHLRNIGQKTGTAGADIHAAAGWDTIVNVQRLPIAVFDSGIDYTHPDLYQNIWLNQREIPASRRANLTDVNRDGMITFRDLNDPINVGPGKITDLNKNGYIDAGDLLKPMTKNAQGADTGAGGWSDGVSQDGDKYVDDLVGWNFVNNTNDPFDNYGHGTHISGILGASGNNGTGVSGTLWMGQLVGVKFINGTGAGAISWYVSGLEYALAKGIKLSNNSWNDSGYTQILFDAMRNARLKGHLFVAAAGNQGRDADVKPMYPAAFNLDNVVSVAASDRNDKLVSWSNYGVKSVDVAAPGVEILSTNPNKNYGLRSGTSMATPQVTAVIAMVWVLRPEWTYQQVINWVLSTADRVPSLTGKVASGRLNLAAAVKVPPRTATQPPTVRPASINPPVTPSGASLPSALVTEFVAPNESSQVVGLFSFVDEDKKDLDEVFTRMASNR